MTAIWHNDGASWRLLAPTGFPDEAALHSLVEEAPQLLPLAGAPQLVVVGREVQLGNGYADLIAIEPTGRLVIIEVKLARNAEARRAVVAQVLTYAAYLRGLDQATLEQAVLGKHLLQRGYQSLADAVGTNDQEGAFEPALFGEGLSESLVQGRFRLVIVLDSAPDELVRLTGYLESVTDKLLIDLITVLSYAVDGSRVLVPQRVEPDRQRIEPPTNVTRPTAQGRWVENGEAFATTIEDAPAVERPKLQRLYEWACVLEQEGLARLGTYHGAANRTTLLPRLQPENVGLVTIYNDHNAYLTLYRSVFERRAPQSLPRLEALIAPDRIGRGTVTRKITPEVLQALTDAYREAASTTGTIDTTAAASPTEA